ncbi:PAS domain S-box protein [Pedosphaera parvula]|uniref:Multi-sensor signal transduction histidine kinase n=1 Tax=Pedosphaera parvula (strain Ellin514) TaxID=320771 RepID=B9XSJ3_PEDPL|nr:PAS domain S-box protein [Pedosphaera parvula]EEF57193.1 multi-sensor signal transduction histidine kinase [Pedosphaera parvula Ellin514]
MGKTLRVLIVEDSAADVLLVIRHLHKGGYEVVHEQVDTEAAFITQLQAKEWDVIIADYSLPRFSAIRALKLLQNTRIDLPFIIVSGAIGEEVAVAAMKSGAHDYLLKNSLARLIPVIDRELGEAQVRRERRQAEEAYHRLAAIVESSGDAIFGEELDGTVTSWNQGAERIFGYQAEEVKGRSLLLMIPPERREAEAKLNRRERVSPFETVMIRKDGRRIDVSVTISPITDAMGNIVGVSNIARDITERKRAESYMAALSKLGQSLSSASTPVEAARVISRIAEEIFRWDAFVLDLYSPESREIQTVLNIDTIEGMREEVGSSYVDKRPSSTARRIIENGAELILRDQGHAEIPGTIPFGDITKRSASMMFVPIRYQAKVIGILSVQSYKMGAYGQGDLSTFQTLADYCGGALERIRVREALRHSEDRFRRVVESNMIGIFFWQENGRIFEANDKYLSMVGFTRGDLELGQVDWRKMTPPEYAVRDQQILKRLEVSGICEPVEKEYVRKDGFRIPVLIGAASLGEGSNEGVCFVVDITERKQAEVELTKSREELRALAAHLQFIREEERKHITREIHDELGQSLTGFKMDLAWMRARLLGEDSKASRQQLIDKIENMARLIDETANVVRRLCTELRPGVLDDLGLTAAIEWQIREYQNRTGIRCSTEIESGDLGVDAERSTALFRIFQELMTNTARHAQASRVEVSLKRIGSEIVLEVRDNGRGIKENEKAGTKSLGLVGMRERALVLGGELEIAGKPGRGTMVRVRVPLAGRHQKTEKLEFQKLSELGETRESKK